MVDVQEGIEVTLPPTVEDLEERVAELEVDLAAAQRKLVHVSEVSRRLLRSGNPGRRAAGQDLRSILAI